MKLYAYEQEVRRAYSIYETGTSYLLSTKEKQSVNTKFYDIDYTLIGTFEIYDYFEHEGQVLSFQILKDGPEHQSPQILSSPAAFSTYRDINELFQNTPQFTVAETAAMLTLSEQRIRALIQNGQLHAQRKGGRWLVSGLEILAFSQQERPAHRPQKTDARQ